MNAGRRRPSTSNHQKNGIECVAPFKDSHKKIYFRVDGEGHGCISNGNVLILCYMHLRIPETDREK